MHRAIVERLVAEEEEALLAELSCIPNLYRVERRGALLLAEVGRARYATGRLGLTGPAVPLLGERTESRIVLALACDNYDTDPPSLSFVTDWEACEELPWAEWPKGRGLVQQHHLTGKPFVCRTGTREFHTHFQHGDEPWDKLRSRMRPRDLVLGVARDLLSKQVFV